MSREKIRFNDLRRMLLGISNNKLAHCLREFEQNKIVKHIQYDEIPSRVEYSFTELGEKFHPAIILLNEWGQKAMDANAN